MAKQLTSLASEVSQNAGVRAVVVSSSTGRAFCVGADLKERNNFSDAELQAQRPLIRELFRALLDLPVGTVAAVAGFALGGGFEIALSCDLIVADDDGVVVVRRKDAANILQLSREREEPAAGAS